MKTLSDISQRERILGGLWGSLVGDALGVPVEFKDRAEVQADPVRDMRGFGTHHQPPGTWSDDSSLLLCSTDSLVQHEFDTADMGRRFLAWYRENLWTPHGRVFDVGMATTDALTRIAHGTFAEHAGRNDESSNGNGSLMRIIPVSLRFAGAPTRQLIDRVHRASAITHRHPRSQMVCGLHSLVVRELLCGMDAQAAVAHGVESFRSWYEPDPFWSVELDACHLALDDDLKNQPGSAIESSGYVVHTLTASLWCLLTTASFEQCVLKAVNLGGDTDTTGCVAGGLAGVCYGMGAIPEKWLTTLARHDEVESLFNRFVDTIH